MKKRFKCIGITLLLMVMGISGNYTDKSLCFSLAPQSIVAKAYSTGDYSVNTPSGINVRIEAGTSHDKVGAAKNGTSFTVEQTNGDWGYTKAISCTNGTKSGWVCLSYCKANGDGTKSSFSSATYEVKVSSTLRVRSEPNTSSSIKNNLKNGTYVYITSQTGNWGYASNYGGYVCMDYCKFVSNSDLTGSGGGGSSSGSNGNYVTNAISSGSTYTITPACATGSALDVQGWGTDNGTNIQIWSSTGGNNQKFKAILVSNGYYTFYDVNSGKVLDVSCGIALSGINIQLYEYNGTAAQLWRLIDAGGGYYYLQSKINPSYYLDVNGAGNSDGTNIQLYKGNGSAAQKFKFTGTNPTGSICGGSSSLISTGSKPASNIIKYSRAKDGSTYLSKNFKLSEFACHDGSDTVYVDQQLIYYCQMIREHFGKPVTINSGYRTPEYNSTLKGAVPDSYHTKGMAADIAVSGISPSVVANYASAIGVKGIGRYSTFTHIDTRTTNATWRG